MALATLTMKATFGLGIFLELYRSANRAGLMSDQHEPPGFSLLRDVLNLRTTREGVHRSARRRANTPVYTRITGGS